MAANTIATTTTLAGEQSPTTRVNLKSSTKPAPSEQQHDQDDHFFWTYTEEPHRSRRMAIIKAHPEVHFDQIMTEDADGN